MVPKGPMPLMPQAVPVRRSSPCRSDCPSRPIQLQRINVDSRFVSEKGQDVSGSVRYLRQLPNAHCFKPLADLPSAVSDGQVFLPSGSLAFMCRRVLNLRARVAQDHVRCCFVLSQISRNMSCSSGGLIRPRILRVTSCKLGEIRPSSRLPTAQWQWQSLSHTFEGAFGTYRRLGLAIFRMLFLQPPVDLNIRARVAQRHSQCCFAFRLMSNTRSESSGYFIRQLCIELLVVSAVAD